MRCSPRPPSRSASCRTSRAPSRTTRRGSCATPGSRCSRGPRPGWRRSGICSPIGTRRARPPVVPSEPVADDVRERWRARLATGGEVSELEGLALLTDYGVPTTEARGATSIDGAIAAAEELGWPVAMKTAAPGVQHKSDVGGVVLGLKDAAGLRAAYEDMASRLGPQVVVAPMAPHGVELALGIVRDPQFGPLVLVAAGGVLVEVLHDRRLAFPPLDASRARALIDRLRVRPMLDGVRGTPPGRHRCAGPCRRAPLAPGRRSRRPARRARREPGDRDAERVRRGRRPRRPSPAVGFARRR